LPLFRNLLYREGDSDADAWEAVVPLKRWPSGRETYAAPSEPIDRQNDLNPIAPNPRLKNGLLPSAMLIASVIAFVGTSVTAFLGYGSALHWGMDRCAGNARALSAQQAREAREQYTRGMTIYRASRPVAIALAFLIAYLVYRRYRAAQQAVEADGRASS